MRKLDSILDIDMDFFLEKLPEDPAPEGERLNSKDYPVWDKKRVECYLSSNLHLSSNNRIPAIKRETHDQIIKVCDDLIKAGILKKPFCLIHIDSHDDLFGCYACSKKSKGNKNRKKAEAWEEVVELAATRDRDKLSHLDLCCCTEGNYISYMLLMNWLSKCTWVCHNDCCPLYYSPFGGISDGRIGVPPLPNGANTCIEAWEGLFPTSPSIMRALFGNDFPAAESMYDPSQLFQELRPGEDAIPFRQEWCDDYSSTVNHRLAFVAESPSYTPEESDVIRDITLGRFLDYEAGEALLLAAKLALDALNR